MKKVKNMNGIELEEKNGAVTQTAPKESDLPFFSPGNHSFNEGIALATRSIAAATIFNHILFWLRFNKSKDFNQYDGRTWVYEKMSDISKQLPYLSEQQVKDGISILVKHGYLLKANHSKNKFERTNWYAVPQEEWIGIQKMFSKRSTDPIASFHRTKGEVLQNFSYKDKDRKEDIEKEDREEEQAPPAPPIFKALPKKKECVAKVKLVSFGEHVKLRPGEYEASVASIGKFLTDHYIEAINNYVPNRKKGPYLDYAAAIRSWHTSDKHQGSVPIEKNASGNTKVASEQEIAARRHLVAEFRKKHWTLLKEREIYFEDKITHLHFQNDKIFYNDSNFNDLIKHCLIKHNLRNL